MLEFVKISSNYITTIFNNRKVITSVITFLLALSIMHQALDARGAPGKSKYEPPKLYKKITIGGGMDPYKVSEYKITQHISETAVQRHKEWINDFSIESANDFIDNVKDEYLLAHIERLGEDKLKEIGIVYWDRNFNKVKNPDLVDYRKKYKAYIKNEIEQGLRNFALSLNPIEKKYLIEYAKENGAIHRSVEYINFNLIKKWIAKIDAENLEISSEFPLKLINDDSLKSYSSLLDVPRYQDAHEYQYSVKAFNDYILNKPELSKLRIEKWSIRGIEDIQNLWRIIRVLEQPLPGNEPELIFFLDQALAISPIKKMSNAWLKNHKFKPKILSHDDIKLFLSEFSGRTVIVVGHIESNMFVQDRGADLPPLKIDIKDFILAAEENNVFLLPIGCGSAIAGAHFGFTRNIKSDEVANLLNLIPSEQLKGRLKISDVIIAFNSIGSISVDAQNFARHIDISVNEREGDKKGEILMITRIPSQMYNNNHTTFSSYYSDWESENRPILDSGPLSFWRANYRENFIITLFITGISFFAIPICLRWLRKERLIFSRNLITKSESLIIKSSYIFGTLCIVSILIRIVLVIWPVILIVIGFCAFMAFFEHYLHHK